MYIVRDPFPYQHGLQRVAESNVANNTAVEHITQLWLADLARGLQGFHSSTLSFFKFWLSHIQSRADKQFLYELNCFLLLLISVFYQHSGGKHLLSPLRCLFGCVIRSLTVSIKLDINSKKVKDIYCVSEFHTAFSNENRLFQFQKSACGQTNENY